MEVVGFEDAIREVVVKSVKAAFQRIGKQRLGTYLSLSGEYSLRGRSESADLCPFI